MTDAVYLPDPGQSSLERARDHARFLLNSGKGISGYQIKVTAGVHEGAVSVFEGTPCVIGGSAEADIILTGDGLAPVHARLTPIPGFGGRLRVDAVGGRVFFDDESYLEPGEYAELTGRTGMTFGRARIEAGAVIDGRQATRALIFVASAAVLSFLFFSIVFSTFTQTSSSLKALTQPINPALSSQIAGNGEAIDLGAALELTRDQLATQGLAHMIKAQDIAPQSIKLDGIVPLNFTANWTGFLQWYDVQKNFPALINGVTVAGTSEDIPAISTVWLGEQPMVEFSDGTRGIEGSILKGNWRIAAIDSEQVTFERNGAEVAVRY